MAILPALTALVVGLPRSAVGLLLGAGGVGYAAVKSRALGRLRRWHVLLLAAVATAVVPALRQGATSGLRGLMVFVSNILGLVTGRLKVVVIGGRKTVVEAR